ncbi:hypothetical protein ACFX2C_026823 [Malus domestica]
MSNHLNNHFGIRFNNNIIVPVVDASHKSCPDCSRFPSRRGVVQLSSGAPRAMKQTGKIPTNPSHPGPERFPTPRGICVNFESPKRRLHPPTDPAFQRRCPRSSPSLDSRSLT